MEPTTSRASVLVIGGGIAGLTTAYELGKRGVAATVVEAAARPGGVIRTERIDGYVLEAGPDSLLTSKPWGVALCRELGVELVPAQSRQVYVLSDGRLHPLPPGLLLTMPARLGPFLRSPLISPRGKLRMAFDLVLPRGSHADESLGSFVRRRLGQEVLDKIADPLLAGIYVADPDRLSLAATFPRLLEMEESHRSLILAARKLQPRANVTPPLFQAPRTGMMAIVEALAPRVDVRCATPVTQLLAPQAVGGQWTARTPRGDLVADAVVLTTPARVAAELLGERHPQLERDLRAMRYTDAHSVSLGFASGTLPPGTGFVVPRREGRPLLACTWASQKFPGRAPAGHLLVRCFMRHEASVEVARAELRDLLGITAAPTVARSYTLPSVNPIYEVGHAARVQALTAQLPPRLYLAGSSYRGIGLPDTIHDAQQLAGAIALALRGPTTDSATSRLAPALS